MSERLSEILERLGVLPDLGSFDAIIDSIRATYDVDHVYYYAMSLGLDAADLGERKVSLLEGVGGLVQSRGRQIAAMSYTPDWIKRYFEAKFFSIDPVLSTATASFDPVNWADLDWGGTGRTQFFNEAVEFGVGNQGYTIPVRGPGGQFAVFTVNKHCSEETWEKLLAEARTDFLLLAHFVHQRVLALAGMDQTHPSRPLSNRECDAMRLIASGLSRGRASEELGISENTFRVYIDSARHKLGALNIPHAIALAAHRGLIPPT